MPGWRFTEGKTGLITSLRMGLALALLLGLAQPADASPPVLKGIRLESSNVVVLAEITAGSPTVVLEGSPSPDVVGWVPRAVVRPDADQTLVEFRLTKLEENELLRVRIGRETSLPTSAFRLRNAAAAEVIATTTNSAPAQAYVNGPGLDLVQSLGIGTEFWISPFFFRLTPDLILGRPSFQEPLFAQAGGLRVISSGTAGLFFALEQTNGILAPVASVPLSGSARRLFPLGSGHLAVIEGSQEYSYSTKQTRLSVFDLATVPPKQVASASWPEMFVEAASSNSLIQLVTQIRSTNSWGTETRIRCLDLTIRSNIQSIASTDVLVSPLAASIEANALVLVGTTPIDTIVWTADLLPNGHIGNLTSVTLSNVHDAISGVARSGRDFAVVTTKWHDDGSSTMALQSFHWNTGAVPNSTGLLDLGLAGRIVIDPRDGGFLAKSSNQKGSSNWGSYSEQGRLWTDTNKIDVFVWPGNAGPKLLGTTTNLGHLRDITIQGNRMLVRSSISTNSTLQLGWFGLDSASGLRQLDQLTIPGYPESSGEYGRTTDGTFVAAYAGFAFGPICLSQDHFWLNQIHYAPIPVSDDYYEWANARALAADVLSISTLDDRLVLGGTVPLTNIWEQLPQSGVSSSSGLDIALSGWRTFTLGKNATVTPVMGDPKPLAWYSRSTHVVSGFRIDVGDLDAVVVPAGPGQPILKTSRLDSDFSSILTSWVWSNHLCILAKRQVFDTNAPIGLMPYYHEELVVRTFRLNQLPALPLVGETIAPLPLNFYSGWGVPSFQADNQGRLLVYAMKQSDMIEYWNTFVGGFITISDTIETVSGMLRRPLLTLGQGFGGTVSPIIPAHWNLKSESASSYQVLAIDASNPAAPKIGKEALLSRPANSRTKIHFTDGLAFQGSTSVDPSIIATNFVVKTGQVVIAITNSILRTNVVTTPLPAPLTNTVSITQSYPLRSLAWPDARAIIGGGAHQLALDQAGILWGWGEGTFGQLGDGTMTSRFEPRPILSNVTSVAAGFRSTLAVRDDGSVWFCGFNILQPPPVNPLGLPPLPIFGSLVPQKVEGLPPIASASAGYLHFLAIATNGTAWGWGDNSFGQLGLATNVSGYTALELTNLPPLNAIAGGGWHTLALATNGIVLSAGRNHFQQLGRSTSDDSLFAPVTGVSNIIRIAADLYTSAALDQSGTVWIWGRLPATSESAVPTNMLSSPEPVRLPAAARDIAMQGTHLLILDVDGRVWTWGCNPMTPLFPATFDPAPVAGISNAIAIAGNRANGTVLTADGRLMTFGDAMQILGGDSTQELVQATHQARVVVTHSYVTNIAPVEVVTGSVRPVVFTNALPVYRWTRFEWLDVIDLADVARPVLRPRLPLPASLLAVTHGGEVVHTRQLDPNGSSTKFAALAYDGAALYDLSELQLAGTRVSLADSTISNLVWTAWSETNGLVHLQSLRLTANLELKAASPIDINPVDMAGLVLNGSAGNLLSAEDRYGSTVISFNSDGSGKVVAEDQMMDEGWEHFAAPVFDPQFGWLKARGYGTIRCLAITTN